MTVKTGSSLLMWDKAAASESFYAISHSAKGPKQIKQCSEKQNANDLCFIYNRRFKKKSVNLVAGDYLICDEDIIITTVLGSCISVCFFTDTSLYCGMNHFMLPESGAAFRNERDIMHTDSAFYGINSMEKLINEILKCGVNKKQLKAKVFGGGEVLSVRSGERTVGEQNIDFIMKFLEIEKIPVVACSVGGDYARKILFFTKTHEVLLNKLGKKYVEEIAQEERHLRYDKQKHGDISFF
jgi:chemotaxis protein CheD